MLKKSTFLILRSNCKTITSEDKMHKVIILFLLLFTILFTPAFARDTYIIGIPYLNTQKTSTPKVEGLINEIYSRANLSVEFKYFPGIRDLKSADSGITDGSAIRTLYVIAQYPNLTNVPTPMMKETISAFSKNPELVIAAPEDIRDLTVGVMRGSLSPTNLAHKYAKKVQMVDSYKSLLTLVEKGRVDAVIMLRSVAKQTIKKLKIQGLTESAPLITKKLYHIVNKKHAHTLNPKLDKAIKELLRDGTIKKFTEEQGISPK
ncbi:hypothetical protein D0S45_17200 [Marinifilum sp. JC120]|nr:hypothetical protein D0S45_17200 [Marinifilum sp. JC120]